MEEASRPKTTKNDLHLARSQFLDAFAALEQAVMRLPPDKSDKALADEIKQLRLIRNDIVHTELRFASFEGNLHAIAVNIMAKKFRARQARLLSLQDFQWLVEESRRIKSKAESA